jgi:hypothetical protein
MYPSFPAVKPSNVHLPMFGMAMVRSGVKKGHGYAWQE